MTVSLVNLGCKVNRYELQSIKTALKNHGHEVRDGLSYADAYVLNTCAVTAEAERKSRQFVAKIRKINNDAIIVIIGCAAEKDRESFEKKGVNYIIGTADKNAAADIICNIKSGARGEASGEIETPYSALKSIPKEYERGEFAYTERARQFIKVQDGCNNMCSYCIIPYLRGRSRSRTIDEVIGELRATELNEAVLIGINLSAYGRDIGSSLTGLIQEIRLAGLGLRLRLGSLEARVIDEELLNGLKGLKNFCPHFHLSLQSGDDGILRDMNRHYDTDFFKERVELIRSFFDDAAITTDIIAGYPTESAEAHLNSLRFAKEIAFSDIHIFPYSERSGTKAAELKARVPDEEIKRRVKAFAKLKNELKNNYTERFIGKKLEVLIEEKRDGEASGYSQNYIRVYVDGDTAVAEKNVYTVEIIKPYKDGVLGRLCAP
jgi:threonylcarbamoyladenosine tRNA methylthiotransferase MtaB